MNILQSFFIGLAVVGCLYWLWMAVGAWRVVRGVAVLAEEEPPDPQAWPRLSVIVPACNEEDTLEAAIRSVLAQDYPDLEVVLIDDRSTDATGRIVDRVADADPRVQPLHITSLPDGWLGKNHALARGVERTAGSWLLFTDADVHLAPGMLRRAIAFCEQRGVDHLAVAPTMWSSGLLLDAAVGAFLRVFCVGMRVWAVADPRSSAFIGVGAFNLVRREAFLKTEGFEWLRLEVADDVGLGLMLKRSGARSCLANGRDLVGLHWYRSLGEMARGVEKAYASVGHGRPGQMVALGLVALLLEAAPLVAISAWSAPGMLPAGLAMAVLGAVGITMLHRWARYPLLPALLVPLGALVGLVLLLRSSWLGFRRGGIVWRGTLYPTPLLRQAARITPRDLLGLPRSSK